MDLEATKTNLLCKWVIKAMEPNESNLLPIPPSQLDETTTFK